MFPLTHYYCTKNIIDKPSPLFVCGAIFPDIPMTGIIPWDLMKEKTIEYSAFVKKTQPTLAEFAQGMLYHEEPYGIDRFVHGDKGYAFVKGAQIVAVLKDSFPNRTQDVAHSFIEYAIEMLMAKKYPELLPELLSAVSAARPFSPTIQTTMVEFFHTDPVATKAAVEAFDGWLEKMDFSTKEIAVQYYTELTNILRRTSLSTETVGSYLAAATNAVKDDYESFLDEVIRKCKEKNL